MRTCLGRAATFFPMKVARLLLGMSLAIASMPTQSAEIGPLAPGRAAGPTEAQAEGASPVLWILGAGALVGLGAMLALSNNGNALASVAVTTNPSGGSASSSGGAQAGGQA